MSFSFVRHNSFSFWCQKLVFNINQHIIYHSSFFIMASCAKQLIFPCCKTGNFNSERALNIHFYFESCQNLSLWAFSSKSTKRKCTLGSNLKFALLILDNINMPSFWIVSKCPLSFHQSFTIPIIITTFKSASTLFCVS